MDIRVVVCEPGKSPEIKFIDNGLKAAQQIVGGYIDVASYILQGYDVVVNDEGLIIGLPPNKFELCGTFFVTRANPDGEWISLTQLEAEEIVTIIENSF